MLRPSTLPTVTVTPTDTGRGLRYVGKCPGLPAFCAVGSGDHWHLSGSTVIYESLFALVDDWQLRMAWTSTCWTPAQW